MLTLIHCLCCLLLLLLLLFVGIGYAIAERLATDGATVLINSRSVKNVDAAVDALRAKGLVNVFGLAGNMGVADSR